MTRTSEMLRPELICAIESVDPKKAAGPHTRVQEVWRVTLTDGRLHFVFIGDHGLKPYCSMIGYECPCVQAVLQKRAARDAGLVGEPHA